MVKAIVKSGVIVPKSPLPEDWTEGTELEVEKHLSSSDSNSELDRWFAELESIASQGDPNDDLALNEALQLIRQQEKELARKKIGLKE